MSAIARAVLKSQAPHGMQRATNRQIEELATFLTTPGPTTIISGAGISTDSGLKDYRSPARLKEPRRQIQHHEFVCKKEVRRRYWSRAFLGYEIFNHAQPNSAHKSLKEIHSNKEVEARCHITQNVDGLLQRAGLDEERIIELHGTVHKVECLACGYQESRAEYQLRCEHKNKGWLEDFKEAMGGHLTFLQDGDAKVEGMFIANFKVPGCIKCGEDVTPALVFFGGSVPRQVTLNARSAIGESRKLLVVGSSLATMSSYDLARRTKANGGSIAIVNYGPTRADHLIDVKLEAAVSDTLRRVNEFLG